jgi:hypothetical protein
MSIRMKIINIRVEKGKDKKRKMGEGREEDRWRIEWK